MIRTWPASLLLALAVVVTPGAAAPQPEQDAVLAVVDRFMTALSTNDFATLAALRVEGSVNIVERPDKSSGTLVARRPFDPAGGKPGAYRERYWDPVVHVRGSIAVVWTPYEFWIDGKTSHCGIDVFEMVKEKGAWRIGNMMWTVEPDACAALRPADPKRIRPAA
jgi:hypothetical protein